MSFDGARAVEYGFGAPGVSVSPLSYGYRVF